jgi:hypothetical protein
VKPCLLVESCYTLIENRSAWISRRVLRGPVSNDDLRFEPPKRVRKEAQCERQVDRRDASVPGLARARARARLGLHARRVRVAFLCVRNPPTIRLYGSPCKEH